MTIAIVLAAWIAISVMVSLALGLLLRGEHQIVDLRDSEQYYAHHAPAGRVVTRPAPTPRQVA